MESDRSDQSSNGEPNAKHPKIELQPSTTSSSSKSQTSIVDCPLLMLPPDILAKIIVKIPIAQWPALELLYDFRPATLIAWRQLRNVNVEREFVIKTETKEDQTSPSIEAILRKLAECSPFLTSIRIDLRVQNTELNLDAVHSLAKFEHLQSISLGNAKDCRPSGRVVSLENVVEFLESTRSRSNLKEMHFLCVDTEHHHATILDRFASSFANGPLKLEKFSFTSLLGGLLIPLDTLDTTRLIDLRLHGYSTADEPDQLSNLIVRATNLRRIEVSFFACHYEDAGECTEQYLAANKNILTALASHENLTSIKLYHGHYRHANPTCHCKEFAPEFLGMLEMIGRRHRLRKLAFESDFFEQSNIDEDEVLATIRKCLPYLRSIKLNIGEINDANVADIVQLKELRHLHLTYWSNTCEVTKIAEQLPRLTRLGLYGLQDFDTNSLVRLSMAKGLTDLRIHYDDLIEAQVYEKWIEEEDGFASKLQVLKIVEGITTEGDDEDEEEDDQDEQALVKLLEKANRLRILDLIGRITDRSLMAIAKSCPQLEMLCVALHSSQTISVERLQEIVDRCPKLKQLIGFDDEIRKRLRLPKYRPIVIVDEETWDRDFDDEDELYDWSAI